MKEAEEVGFEPTDPCGSPVFKTGAINRSTTPPRVAGEAYHKVRCVPRNLRNTGDGALMPVAHACAAAGSATAVARAAADRRHDVARHGRAGRVRAGSWRGRSDRRVPRDIGARASGERQRSR